MAMALACIGSGDGKCDGMEVTKMKMEVATANGDEGGC